MSKQTKAQMTADIDYLRGQLAQQNRRSDFLKGAQEQEKQQQVAKLLLQERRDLAARIRKLDILLELTGGVEDGGSPLRIMR
jgi:hypothetical protein